MDLKELVALNRSGTPKALPSFCTANDFVLDEVLAYAARENVPVLIEATCNQVNQFGGYTGMRPSDFADKVRQKAQKAGLAAGQLILGGDHLGPNPWKHLPADDAMEHAKRLVKDYVEAGFTKIHLDASMACQSEETPSFETVAKRSAELCVVAETHAPVRGNLNYVIGTEVPVPGGESDDMAGICITTPHRLADTIETHDAAFRTAGVSQAMERVIAVVVQPGVDFSHEAIFHYDRKKAQSLTSSLGQFHGLAFEAHSTDYQTTEGLSLLVEDHSIILKVGPEITFRFREGILALDCVEKELDLSDPAQVKTTVLKSMEAEPNDWKKYYGGSPEEVNYLKLYSYSDRIRYYWNRPPVRASVEKLLRNLDTSGLRSGLATQFGITFPCKDQKTDPMALMTERVASTVQRYYQATGWSQNTM